VHFANKNLSRLSRGTRGSATKNAAALWKEAVSESPILESGDVSVVELQDACLLAELLTFAGTLERANL
jgi:hypothetical protein